MSFPVRARRLIAVLGVALGSLALAGCDSGGSETLVLRDPVNPTEARFEFTYTETQWENGRVLVTSAETDQLSAVLDTYGYRRGDVVSARVESVALERLSTAQSSARPEPAKVFGYLERAEVYLGTTTDAPLVATRQPIPFDPEITLDVGPDRDVTQQVQGGPTRALLLLEISDPNLIGSGGDRVRVDVRFRIEVQQ